MLMQITASGNLNFAAPQNNTGIANIGKILPSVEYKGSSVPSAIPTGVVHYFPINIENTQNKTISPPFQQVILLNNTLYSNYEAYNLQNIMFFYPNGSIVPSWLESVNLTSYSIFWLKIGEPLYYNKNITIYIGFGNKTTNFFNGKTVGEAPQFTEPYGKYDNGMYIFPFYDNFIGNQLNKTKWVISANASAIVDNGLTLNFNGIGYMVSKEKFGPRSIFEAFIYSTSDLNNIGFFNISQPFTNGYSGAFIREACGNTYPDQWNLSGEANGCGNAYGYFVKTETNSGLYSIRIISNSSSIQYLNNQLYNTKQPIDRNAPHYPAQVGFDGVVLSVSVELVRVRDLPPNNVMPSVWINGVLQPTNFTEENLGESGKLIISVSPRNDSYITVDGETLSSNGYLSEYLNVGPHNVFVDNPYYQFNFTTVNLTKSVQYLNITLSPPISYPITSYDYPWERVGPAFIPNPQNYFSGNFQYASGHIGLICIDELNPNIIYIASGTEGPGDSGPYGAGGVYKTVDGGLNWIPIDYGLPYSIATALYMNETNPENLLVGFWRYGIYETYDGGGYWQKVSNYTFAKDFTYTDGEIFAGSDQGVIVSNDSGRTWKVIFPQPEIKSISISGNTIYAFSIKNMVLYRSDNLGKTWSAVHNFQNISYDVWAVSASPWNASIVYLSLGIFANLNYKSNTLVSYDGGINFTQDVNAGNTKAIFFDPLNESRVWAYGAAYEAYSTDGGKTFISGPQDTDNMGMAIDPRNDSILIIGSDQGLFESNDYGKTWHSINGDLSDLLINEFSISSNGELILTDMQDYSAWISHDGGKVWIGGNSPPIPIGGEGTNVYVNPYNSSWVYALPRGVSPMISNDGGFTFQVVPLSNNANYLRAGSIFYADPYNHSIVYLPLPGGLYKGIDYGTQWYLVNNSPTDETTVAMVKPNVFLIGTTDGLYMLENNTLSPIQSVTGYIDSIAVNPENSSIVSVSANIIPYYGGGTQIYLSKDYGKTFTHIPSIFDNLTNYGIFNSVMLFYLNITGYPLIATSSNGIYLSTDFGYSWHDICYNLASGFVTYAEFANKSLYISTYGEGILVYRDFNIENLSATINGITSISNPVVKINGTLINVYEGHFRIFLKPGNYLLEIYNNTFYKKFYLNLSPMEIYNLSVTPIVKTYRVQFVQSGLPSGTAWSVTLNGTTETSATNTISFSEPNGSYSYGIGSVSGYSASPSSGTITVSGKNVTQDITFSPIKYTVTFTSLPPGAPISISYGGNTYNETTPYSIAVNYGTNVSYTYAGSFSGRTGIRYANPTNPSGSLTVTKNITVNTQYTTQYYLTMSSLGGGSVSPSSGWYNASSSVTIHATSNSGYHFAGWSGSGNGSYTGSNNPATIIVDGPITEIASFLNNTYEVTFTESGLPSGTAWNINLSNGESFLASTPSITFKEPNGTYSYTITAANKTYAASPGYFTVNGEPVAISVAFTIQERAQSSSSTELYEIIGAVIAVVVIVATVALMRRKR